MNYKKNTVVAGVKILGRERKTKQVRRNKGSKSYITTYFVYRTENMKCGCPKKYTSFYLRALELNGGCVKCAEHKEKKKVSKPIEVERVIPRNDADVIARPSTQVFGFVWGQQGEDNLRSYRLTKQD